MKQKKSEPMWKTILKKGKLLRRQMFQTERGEYVILMMFYDGDVWFYKSLNQKTVECVNLSRLVK